MSKEKNISATSFQNVLTSKLERRALVVDNNEDIVGLLEMHLQDLSFSVTKAFNGLAGLNLAQNKSYDLIILNDILPGLDGGDIYQSLREDKNFTPVLILCANCQDKINQENKTGNPFTKFHLIKPFGIKAFKDKIQEIIK